MCSLMVARMEDFTTPRWWNVISRLTGVYLTKLFYSKPVNHDYYKLVLYIIPFSRRRKKGWRIRPFKNDQISKKFPQLPSLVMLILGQSGCTYVLIKNAEYLIYISSR